MISMSQGNEIEEYRERLKEMNDRELISTMDAAYSMLSPKANFGKPPRAVYAMHLYECCLEWERRYPKSS
jgi:hypothetical protein